MHVLANGTGRRHTQVGIDVNFRYAILDTFNDFFNGYAVGLAHLTTVSIDDFQPVLRH